MFDIKIKIILKEAIGSWVETVRLGYNKLVI